MVSSCACRNWLAASSAARPALIRSMDLRGTNSRTSLAHVRVCGQDYSAGPDARPLQAAFYAPVCEEVQASAEPDQRPFSGRLANGKRQCCRIETECEVAGLAYAALLPDGLGCSTQICRGAACFHHPWSGEYIHVRQV